MSARIKKEAIPAKFMPAGWKPPKEFAGKGREIISGHGGGCLCFDDGELVSCLTVSTHTPNHEDTARCIRSMGPQKNRPWDFPLGEPRHLYDRGREVPSDLQRILTIPEIALLAGEMLMAVHMGKPAILRRLASIAEGKDLRECLPGSKQFDMESNARHAIETAARKHRRPPTREEVRIELEKIGKRKDSTMNFPVSVLDKHLALAGFGWLEDCPERKRGRPKK